MKQEKKLVVSKSVSLYPDDWERIRIIGHLIGSNDSATIRFIVSQFTDEFLKSSNLASLFPTLGGENG